MPQRRAHGEESGSAADIVIPRALGAYEKRINVQDFIAGVAGGDLVRLDAEGFDRTLLAKRGAHAVLKMIVEDGFFTPTRIPAMCSHLPVNRVAFIDFGMVGRALRAATRELLQTAARPGRAATAGSGGCTGWTGPAMITGSTCR